MSEVLGIIDDGYQESGTIAAVPGLYPAVALTWRPMLQEELVAYYKAAEKASAWQVRQMVAKLLADHVVSWDVRDRQGNVVTIKATAALRLKDRLFNRLFAVVSTQEPPDAQPEVPDDELDAAAADLLAAAQSDKSTAQVREEREQKNS